MGGFSVSKCKLVLAGIVALSLIGGADLAQAQTPVVHAVMFWMNGCPHCEQVMTRVLPPLQQKYGDQLDIQLIEVAKAEDLETLYQVAATFGLSKEETGVPFLVIGRRALVGSEQIPEELPGLIDQLLAAGGAEVPKIEELEKVASPPAGAACAPATPCATETAAAELPIQTILRVDPAGLVLALLVILAMIGALIRVGFDTFKRQSSTRVTPAAWTTWIVPLLVTLGLGVAGYLAYVETFAVSAVCGPIGHCNTVQASPYARLLGVLPIGVLGVLGYLMILGVWASSQLGRGGWASWTRRGAWALAVFGVLFSLYLTMLEPLVIGAVCAWCLTSAVIMTALMLLLARPARRPMPARGE